MYRLRLNRRVQAYRLMRLKPALSRKLETNEI